jgi:hypothetical protein
MAVSSSNNPPSSGADAEKIKPRRAASLRSATVWRSHELCSRWPEPCPRPLPPHIVVRAGATWFRNPDVNASRLRTNDDLFLRKNEIQFTRNWVDDLPTGNNKRYSEAADRFRTVKSEMETVQV